MKRRETKKSSSGLKMIGAILAAVNRDAKTGLAVGLCAVMLSGCGGGSDIAGTIISGGQKPIEVSPETFAPPVSCPPMQLKSNAFLIRKFQRGKEDVPEALLYQATLKDWANSCTKEGGDQRRIKMGLSGTVTPGPAWKGGDVVLPIRVEIETGAEGDKPLESELFQVSVSLPAGSPSETWTLIENKYVIGQEQGAKVVFGFEDRRR